MTKLYGWKVCRTVFLLCVVVSAIAAPAQIFNILFTFDGSDGNVPVANLVQGTDGNLYGVTSAGGPDNMGTVFKITPTGRLTTLHTFSGPDGEYPAGGLTLATDGNFYGTTAADGANVGGTVFKIAPGGAFATLYDFCARPNCADGASPDATLVQGLDGTFYGSAIGGGAFGRGALFKITRTGVFTTMYSFCSEGGHCAGGSFPGGGLTLAANGKFYGTTEQGGTFGESGLGTTFRVSSTGTLTGLDSFNYADGNDPRAPLIQAIDGDLYGTTLGGGESSLCPSEGCGMVFKLTPAGSLSAFYTFCSQPSCNDGAIPIAGLVQATDGNFYGTTQNGGLNECDYSVPGCGTIFKITPTGVLTTLYSFCSQPGCSDGGGPQGGLIQGTDGKLYGTSGGFNAGAVFSLDIGRDPFVAFVRAAGKVGQNGPILGQGFTGTTSVSLNGTSASFTVVSDTLIRATVPVGATTGYVTVTTPGGNLTSNVPFHVIP